MSINTGPTSENESGLAFPVHHLPIAASMKSPERVLANLVQDAFTLCCNVNAGRARFDGKQRL